MHSYVSQKRKKEGRENMKEDNEKRTRKWEKNAERKCEGEEGRY